VSDSNKLITHDKLRRHLRREGMRRRATELPYAPVEVYVDPCSACDLRCTFCPQSDWGNRDRGVMSWELYERVLSELQELRPKKVLLFAYGESLLNKRIFDMIRAATDVGLHVVIHTNAKSLDEEKARALLDSGLAELHFSFDTADRELYNRMRVRSDFDVVVANIRRFLELKEQGGHERPVVYMQELVPYEEGAEPRNSPEYRALFEEWDVVFDPRFMHNFAGASNETKFEVQRLRGRTQCTQLYTRIVVTFDGKLHACCLDAEGYNIVGDLMAGDTIASSWNGSVMQELRQRTNDFDLKGLRPCDTCDQLRLPVRERKRPVKDLVRRTVWNVVAGSGR